MRSCGRIEKDPLLRSTITAVSLLDGPVDADRFARQGRAGQPRHPAPPPACRRQPVLAGPAPVGGRPELRPRLPPPRRQRGRRRDGARRARPGPVGGHAGLRPGPPLWEMYLVDGLADGRSALIQKLHHAITDGVGSIQLALTLFDLEREPSDPGPLPERPGGPRARARVERLRRRRRHVGRRQLGIAQRSRRCASRRACATRSADSGRRRRRLTDTVGSVGRLLAPATRPLSPVMARPLAQRALRHARAAPRRPPAAPPRLPTASSTTPSWPPSPAGCSATTPHTAHRSTRCA